MKVLVIHSGHLMSTIDVATGLIAGLEANGVRVAQYPLHEPLALAQRLVGYAADAGEELPDQLVYNMAAGGIPGAALLVEADIVIAITGRNLPWRIIEAIRKGGITTALLCTESPYTTRQFERHDAAIYDYVFTNERAALGLFDRNPAPRVHYLPHAYNPAVHQPGSGGPPQTDVLFIGTGFAERRALFSAVDWQGIRHTLLGPLWDGATDSATVIDHGIDNVEAVARYHHATICLNHHRTTANWHEGTTISDAAESLGPRAYEIAACRAFQLCDDSRPELGEVFGDAVPTYKAGDSADLERQMRYWLARPDARAAHAAAAFEAVRPHTWAARAAQMLSVVATRPRVLQFAS